MTAPDPITVEIVGNALAVTAEQITTRMIRSAISTVVKEMEDCSAAIFDGEGRLLAESASIPIHLNCIGICLRTIVEHYHPLAEWRPGDVVITNDPYAGGESLSSHHTNDIIAYHPVFHEGRLVAFTALNAHHMDVGAMWMGTRGWGVDIHQEGLRIPPLKIVEGGRLDRKLLRLIVNNTRVPENLENDLMSQVASVQLAGEEMAALFARYGTATLEACFAALIDYSERRTRAELARIPDGVYRHEEPILDDGNKGGPYVIRLAATVEKGEVTLDFTGTDRQIKGPVNAPLAATMAAVYYAMRCLTDSAIPNTEGCKRPIRVVAPPGTLVNAQYPAACYQRMIVCHTLVDLVMGALAAAAPERVMGDSCGCLYNSTVMWDAAERRPAVCSEVVPGGIGATARADGLNVMSAHVTNCPIPPVEAVEIDVPVLYRRREFHEGSGGAGRWRGGLGVVLAYQVLGDEPRLYNTSQKSVVTPQGVLGGRPGDGGRWVINEGGNRERRLPFAIGDGEPLEVGDTVTHYTPGGGGYGDPREREPWRVAADARAGLITVEAAARDYGVRLDPATFDVLGRA